MSLFLILGVLIIIGGGLLVFTILNSSSVKLSKEDYSGYEASEVEEFVEKCMLQTAFKAIKLIGHQGGIIFEEQGGTAPETYRHRSVNYDGYSLLKGVVGPYRLPGIAGRHGRSCIPGDPAIVYNAENCPSTAFPFRSSDSGDFSLSELDSSPPPTYPDYVRLYNRMKLPPLFPDEMKNLLPNYEDVGNYLNIYNTLKTFMMNNISACLDFSLLENQAGIEVIKQGDFQIQPIIGGDYFSVSMKFPLKVIPSSGSPVKLSEFTVNTKLRFKQSYTLLKHLLQNEAKDFNFDTHHPAMTLHGIKSNVTDFGNYRILEVKDDYSALVSGAGFEPLSLYSAIQKTPPAMSYIHYENLDAVSGLRNAIIRCSGINNPWENLTRLSVGIGSNMSRPAIECIWKAYKELYGADYKKVYDFDMEDEGMPSWRFKTANCGWDQKCQYIGANLDTGDYLTYLLIEFSDGTYKDYLNISLPLVNHFPTIGVVCNKVVLASTPPSTQFLCAVNSTDIDLLTGADHLWLDVSVPISNVQQDQTGDFVAWVFSIDGSISQARFSVRDEHGGSVSKTLILS